MAKSKVRVEIPKNVDEKLKLAGKINDKHVLDGVNSPLKGLEDETWENSAPNIALAQAKHDAAKALEKEVEKLYEARDKFLVPIDATIKASRDLLLGKFSKSPKKLGDWGFVVDDTPKAKKGGKLTPPFPPPIK